MASEDLDHDEDMDEEVCEMKTSSSLQQILGFIAQERNKDDNQNSKEGTYKFEYYSAVQFTVTLHFITVYMIYLQKLIDNSKSINMY